MSFGVGPTDVLQAIRFVKVTYDSWKDAPERYRAITRRLRSLRGHLERLARYHEDSQCLKSRRSQSDLGDALFAINDTLKQLTRIIDKRSGLTFWDRLRLNNSQINDLSAALDRHILDLTCLCSSIGLQLDREIQRGQQDIQRGQTELLHLVGQLLPREVPTATIEALAESVDSLEMSESFMTDYGDEDDPAVWREFRRKAIAEGVASRELEIYQAHLHDILRTVAANHRGRRRKRSSPHTTRIDSAEPTRSSSRRSPRRDDERAYSPYFAERCHSRSPRLSTENRGRSHLLPADGWREVTLSPFPDGETVHMTRERSSKRRRSRSIVTESRSSITYMYRTPRSMERKR